MKIGDTVWLRRGAPTQMRITEMARWRGKCLDLDRHRVKVEWSPDRVWWEHRDNVEPYPFVGQVDFPSENAA